MSEPARNMQNSDQTYGVADLSSDQAIESAALAGAAAIQRLVAERNELRARLFAQQRETAALRAANEDLRQRLLTIHQHYVEMAKRVVGHLEQVDGTMREVTQEAFEGQPESLEMSEEEAKRSPASLAQRLAEADQSERGRPNGADRNQE
jgi:predicted ribosome quality control (RQC) complex YloA/Tae2 family protein